MVDGGMDGGMEKVCALVHCETKSPPRRGGGQQHVVWRGG